MNLDITGHHVEVTSALKDYVSSKLTRLERHFDQVNKAHAVLRVEKLQQTAEATIKVPGGTLHALASGKDMYAAIDALADKLERQVRRHKEKLTNHHRSEGGIKMLD